MLTWLTKWDRVSRSSTDLEAIAASSHPRVQGSSPGQEPGLRPGGRSRQGPQSPRKRVNGLRSAQARRHPKGCEGLSAGAADQPPGWAVLKGEPQLSRGLWPRAAPAAVTAVGVLAPRPRGHSGKAVRRANCPHPSGGCRWRCDPACRAHVGAVCPSALGAAGQPGPSRAVGGRASSP